MVAFSSHLLESSEGVENPFACLPFPLHAPQIRVENRRDAGLSFERGVEIVPLMPEEYPSSVSL